jgi:hypothetical protein
MRFSDVGCSHIDSVRRLEVYAGYRNGCVFALRLMAISKVLIEEGVNIATVYYNSVRSIAAISVDHQDDCSGKHHLPQLAEPGGAL